MDTRQLESSAPRAAAAQASNARLWTGRTIGILAVLFLVFDGATKVLRHPSSVEFTVELGYYAGDVPVIGLVLLLCTALYAVPRTSILGAILLTGYLGGAVATQFRVGGPLFSHTLFPVYIALMVWGALYLQDGRVRALLAPRRDE